MLQAQILHKMRNWEYKVLTSALPTKTTASANSHCLGSISILQVFAWVNGHIEEPQFCRTQVSEDKREQAPVIEDQELQIRQPRQVLRSESWMAKLRASRWGKSRVSSSFLLIIIENEMMATSTTQVPVFKACKCTSGKCPPS